MFLNMTILAEGRLQYKVQLFQKVRYKGCNLPVKPVVIVVVTREINR
jgi:hypothetical protein